MEILTSDELEKAKNVFIVITGNDYRNFPVTIFKSYSFEKHIIEEGGNWYHYHNGVVWYNMHSARFLNIEVRYIYGRKLRKMIIPDIEVHHRHQSRRRIGVTIKGKGKIFDNFEEANEARKKFIEKSTIPLEHMDNRVFLCIKSLPGYLVKDWKYKIDAISIISDRIILQEKKTGKLIELPEEMKLLELYKNHIMDTALFNENYWRTVSR